MRTARSSGAGTDATASPFPRAEVPLLPCRVFSIAAASVLGSSSSPPIPCLPFSVALSASVVVSTQAGAMDPQAQAQAQAQAEAIYWDFANFTVRTYGPLVVRLLASRRREPALTVHPVGRLAPRRCRRHAVLPLPQDAFQRPTAAPLLGRLDHCSAGRFGHPGMRRAWKTRLPIS